MIDSLVIRQFRGHEHLEVEFEPDMNLIVGPNGSGKTSVLEAVYTTLTGSSWRGGSDDLVQHGMDWATVELNVDGDTYKLELDGRSGRLQKKRYINSESKRTGYPTVLLLEPTMIDLVAAGPSRRREWLDGVLSIANDDYSRALAQYERSLSQRNALLKREVRSKDQLFVWNIKLAELGAKLATARFELIKDSSPKILDLFKQVAGYTKSISIEYQPKLDVDDYSQQFMNYLEAKLERDISIGFTPTGPHREDIQILSKSGPARDHLSRGEQLILAFALVYSQASLVEPIAVLVDDYTSDLDQEKSKQLTETIKQQTIISTTSNSQKHAVKLQLP